MPWLLAMAGRTVRVALVGSWAIGTVVSLFAQYWVPAALENFAGVSLLESCLLAVLLALYQGGRFALIAGLNQRVQRQRHGSVIAFGLACVAGELLYPLLFPWYWGATLHAVPHLIQLAGLGGPIAVGVPLWITNACVARVVQSRLQRQAVPLGLTLANVLFLSLTLGYGHARVTEADERARKAERGFIGIVQANQPLAQTRRERSTALSTFVRLSRLLESQGPLDLIVWSETSVPGAVHEGAAQSILGPRVASQLRTPVLFGVHLVGGGLGKGLARHYNAALLTDRGQKLVGRYDKRHLMPFSERLPLQSWLPQSVVRALPYRLFSPGVRSSVLRNGDHSLGVRICYEDLLAGVGFEARKGATPELLLSLSNDAWFGDTSEPWMHLAMAKFRAIEEQSYLVRASNSGVSAFVDSAGRVVSQLEPFQRGTLRLRVPYLRSEASVFARFGNLPWWVCSLWLGYLCWYSPAPRAGSRPFGRRAS